jgi:hypothetical protein
MDESSFLIIRQSDVAPETLPELREVLEAHVERILTDIGALFFCDSLDENKHYHVVTRQNLPADVIIITKPDCIQVRTHLPDYKPMTFYTGKSFFFDRETFKAVLCSQLDSLATCAFIITQAEINF